MLLRTLLVLNLVVGVILIAAMLGSFIFEPQFREFFTKQPARTDAGMLVPILRVWLLFAAPALAAIHLLVSQLLEMVETVRAGEPFVPDNAVRMKTIAWSVLALQLFDLICGVMAASMNAAGSRIFWSFSLTGWVAVALLFVLARVFEEGTRIRTDLEAMI